MLWCGPPFFNDTIWGKTFRDYYSLYLHFQHQEVVVLFHHLIRRIYYYQFLFLCEWNKQK